MSKVRKTRNPEEQAATGLPIAIILGAVVFLGIYILAVDGMDSSRRDARVYLPQSPVTAKE